MDNKKIYIGLGVATLAVIGIGYYYHKRKSNSSGSSGSLASDANVSDKLKSLLKKYNENTQIFDSPSLPNQKVKKTQPIDIQKVELLVSTLSSKEKEIFSYALNLLDSILDKAIAQSKKGKLTAEQTFGYLGELMEGLQKKYSEKELNELEPKFKKIFG